MVLGLMMFSFISFLILLSLLVPFDSFGESKYVNMHSVFTFPKVQVLS